MLKLSQLHINDIKNLNLHSVSKTMLYQKMPQNLAKDTFKEKLILNQENSPVGRRKDVPNLEGNNHFEPQRNPQAMRNTGYPQRGSAVLNFCILWVVTATNLQKQSIWEFQDWHFFSTRLALQIWKSTISLFIEFFQRLPASIRESEKRKIKRDVYHGAFQGVLIEVCSFNSSEGIKHQAEGRKACVRPRRQDLGSQISPRVGKN